MPFERMVERLMATVPPLLDASRSLVKGEATQIVRYRKGESYAKHFDVKNGRVAQVHVPISRATPVHVRLVVHRLMPEAPADRCSLTLTGVATSAASSHRHLLFEQRQRRRRHLVRAQHWVPRHDAREWQPA